MASSREREESKCGEQDVQTPAVSGEFDSVDRAVHDRRSLVKLTLAEKASVRLPRAMAWDFAFPPSAWAVSRRIGLARAG